MSLWCRLWEDMPNDPKFRTIARRAGRPVSEVLAVFVHMMTSAAGSAERGTLEGWSDEDVATAIEAEPDHVAAIRAAMQGKVLDGERLTGWSKRQPLREDPSTERVRALRERRQAERNASPEPETNGNAAPELETQGNASKHAETPEQIRAEQKQAGIGLGTVAAGGEPEPATDADEARAAILAALGPDAPDDRDWQPMAELLANAPLARVVALIRAEVPRRRGKPIRRWAMWAKVLAERLAQPAAPAPLRTGAFVDLPAGRIPHGVIREKAAGGAWPRSFGPAPGQPGCLIPPGVLGSAPILLQGAAVESQ